MVSDLINVLKPIAEMVKFLYNIIVHPVETLNQILQWLLSYVPAVCCLFIIFYAATGSHKILRMLMLTIAIFVVLTASLKWQMTELFIVAIIGIALIKLMGMMV